MAQRGARQGVDRAGRAALWGGMENERLQHLEEELAHQVRVTDELSQVVARQDRELQELRRRVALLMEREAEREAEAGGAAPLADPKPPHW